MDPRQRRPGVVSRRGMWPPELISCFFAIFLDRPLVHLLHRSLVGPRAPLSQVSAGPKNAQQLNRPFPTPHEPHARASPGVDHDARVA